ncbi:hypothetical protein ACFL96_03270 [Thermoproteota archaeon]
MTIKNKINIGTIAVMLFIILSAILIIQITLKLIGRSPTDIQILYIAFGVIVSYLFFMSYKIGEFVGEVREFMKISKNTFRKLGLEISIRK